MTRAEAVLAVAEIAMVNGSDPDAPRAIVSEAEAPADPVGDVQVVALDSADKAQDTALNGAQVTAAQGIVESVAQGQLPRETGIQMLVNFFNIPGDVASKLMGTVGQSFKPTEIT